MKLTDQEGLAESIPALLTLALIRRHFVPLAPRTLKRWTTCGKFPAADIKQGTKVRFWKRETVEAWVRERAEAA